MYYYTLFENAWEIYSKNIKNLFLSKLIAIKNDLVNNVGSVWEVTPLRKDEEKWNTDVQFAVISMTKKNKA